MSDQTVLIGVVPAIARRTRTVRKFKIFHLERILADVTVIGSDSTYPPVFGVGEATYGQNVAIVVIAETVQEARELATDSAAGESSHVWLDRRTSTITEIGTASKDAQKARVVLIDCNEG